MTYPQQQPYPPQPGYPPPTAPAQPYAPPPQAPPYAPQPGYPAPGPGFQQPPPQQPYPPQQYAPPPQQQYAPAMPYPPQEFVPEAPPPTVSDFFEQPASGGGKALSFNMVGVRYTGTVVRDVTDADMERAREMGSRPGMMGAVAKHPDGRDKINMKVPVLLDQPTAEFPTGIAVWYVKGNERSELLRAMQMAGAEPGPPKGGDRIDITYTHDEPSRSGFNPRKVKHIVYTVGNGVLPQMPAAPQQMVSYGPAVGQPFNPPQPLYNQPPQQYAQQPQMQMAQPDPALAYQQATGQQMPPQNGYAQQPPAQPQFQQPGYPPLPPPPQNLQQVMPPPAFQGTIPPEYSQGYGYQQPPPTGPGAPQGVPNGSTSGAPPTAAASPSSNPGGPPPDWPADVPFIPGLKPEQARIAALHHLGQAPPQ